MDEFLGLYGSVRCSEMNGQSMDGSPIVRFGKGGMRLIVLTLVCLNEISVGTMKQIPPDVLLA